MATRVLVVTQDDPFYLPQFFESFLSSLPDSVNVVQITVMDPFDESFPALILRMYRLYGPVNFVRRGIQFVRRKAVDTLGFGTYSVESIARRYDVPVDHRRSVNTDSFVDSIVGENVDVILSVAAPEIFDSKVLAAPNWGCLNVHTSELPKYRGMLPTFWALYHGDDEVGATVHTMSEEIDRGEIVRQTTFPVDETDTLDDVIVRGKRLGGELAAAALADVDANTVDREPVEGEGSYFSFPTVADRREFQRRGGELL